MRKVMAVTEMNDEKRFQDRINHILGRPWANPVVDIKFSVTYSPHGGVRYTAFIIMEAYAA